ncbi:MAG: phosphate ABC transporter permease subunit PstC [Azospirillum sp.]|nr:phosphate ABC transporter permease subunit PstC [Azospirillum sp.]
MQISIFLGLLLILTVAGYYIGQRRAFVVADGPISRLHSVPGYYGAYVALWAGLPALLLCLVFFMVEGSLLLRLVVGGLPDHLIAGYDQNLDLMRADILNLAAGITTGRVPDPELVAAAARYNFLHELGNWSLLAVGSAMALFGLVHARRRINCDLRARNQVEAVIEIMMVICSLVAILTTVGIVLSMLFEALRFFAKVPVTEFLFGLQWNAQASIRADQAMGAGSFGAVPVFAGTLLITAIAMLVAVPVGLLAAIYMSEYASPRTRTAVKPLLEVLAGIPTVVYGFFAALTMAPVVRQLGGSLGFETSAQSALAAGIVMGIMIVPYVSSLSDDVINSVPQSLRDGSYALGATKSETILQVILPAALPGIVGAIMLAISRAIGETMIVTMAAGLSANLTANPLEAVTTVTAQIASTIKGDQEFDSAKTLSAFGLGLVLFVVTLCLNVIALRMVQKFREKYD